MSKRLGRAALAAAIALHWAASAAAQTVFSTPYIGDRVIYVDTVADMQALPAGKLKDGTVVVTSRYSSSHTAGDGSGNAYAWDDGSSATADGGFVITDTGGRWQALDKTVANALKWGCLPDDSGSATANAARIDAMIASGARALYFPGLTSGTQTLYYTDGGHELVEEQKLYGDGVDVKLWASSALSGGTMLTLDRNNIVYDIALDGTSSTTSTGIAFAAAATNVRVHDANIQSFYNNVVFNDAYVLAFERCRCISAGNIGFKFEGSDNNAITISACEAFNNTNGNIELGGSGTGVQILNCTIQGSNPGILQNQASTINSLVVRDNYFEINGGNRSLYQDSGTTCRLNAPIITGNSFNGSYTLPTIEITRWDGGELGPNRIGGTGVGRYLGVVLGSSCRNSNISFQGVATATDYAFGPVRDAGKNSYRTVGKSSVPTVGSWTAGQRVVNTGTGTTLGWRCTTSGALASAWQAATAYSVGNYVLNDTDKIYVCVSAGTSAGSGGPTGTSTGITDNTVTWDYFSALAVFTTETGN